MEVEEIKKLMMTIGITSLLMIAVVQPASAVSITGAVDKYGTSGTLSMGSSSASGGTSSQAPGAGLTVFVTYVYASGLITDEYTVTASGAGASGGVYATAASKHTSTLSKKAKADHTVNYQGQVWSGPTSINW